VLKGDELVVETVDDEEVAFDVLGYLEGGEFVVAEECAKLESLLLT
jgi:uncharacterized protein YacL